MPEVRPATPEDYAVFARLFPMLEVHDPVPSAQRFSAGLLPQVAMWCPDGQARGMAVWSRYGGVGHLRNLVVDPDWRGRRGAAAMMDHVAGVLARCGAAHWYLNVKTDNEAARRAYLRYGFVDAFEVWGVDLDPGIVPTLPRVAGVEVSIARAEVDEPVARALGLPPARIAHARAQPGTRCLVARRGATTLGLAAFSPTFPGAYPFSVVDPSVTGTLLRACRRYADPAVEGPWHLPVEGQPLLRDALLAMGGVVTLHIQRMTATLPSVRGRA